MRIPSLDGLRAIAISLVIICHLGNDLGITDFFNSGDLGVRVFFVISGFLITGLLLKEFDRDGTISLAQFYFRRTLRIFPAFYAYLAIMLLVSALGWSHLTPAGAIPAVTYTSNFWSMGSQSGYVTSHTWSLSTEEQFYVIWPALLLLSGRKLAPYVLLVLVISSPLLRGAIYVYTRQPALVTATYLNLDHIGMGCLLAFWRNGLHSNALYMRIISSRAVYLLPVLILIVAAQGNHPSFHRTVGLFLINAAIALCIDWAVTFPQGMVGRELNRTWVVWIGTLSYSIYLWQQPFLHFYSDPPALTGPLPAWFTHPVVALACTLACAMASFYLIERPCLKFRDRRASARDTFRKPHPDLSAS
jgi:peptidoglycan/LPS O-acetylase OafA/YrhL